MVSLLKTSHLEVIANLQFPGLNACSKIACLCAWYWSLKKSARCQDHRTKPCLLCWLCLALYAPISVQISTYERVTIFLLMMQGAAVGKYIMRFYIAQLSRMAQQTKENLQPLPICLMNGLLLRSHGPCLFVYPHGLPFLEAGYLTGYIEFGEIEVSSENSELTFTITNTSPPSQSQDYFLLERIRLVRSSWS